jgi:hypothetical protein
MGLRRRLASFFRGGAATLDPTESDPRMVLPPDLPPPPHRRHEAGRAYTGAPTSESPPGAKETEDDDRH